MSQRCTQPAANEAMLQFPVPLADLARPHQALEGALQAALAEVVASGWFMFGPQHQRFEAEFASFCGRQHAVAVANGTDALELALRAVGVGAGDRVVTVANAGGYASTAILALGAVPVFVDVDANLTLDPLDLSAALDRDPAIRAVVITHLYGRLADMAGIQAALQGRSIPLIEDCAQAHGARRGATRAGGFGDLGTFSFYPTKNLGALGDGGAVVTDQTDWAERLRQLRQYGWRERYHSEVPGGRNSRLDEIQAAVLRVKLPHLDAWNAERRRIAGRIRAAAGRIGCQVSPPTEPEADVAHLCVVRSPQREALRQHLAGAGIQTAIHYPVLDAQQPGFRDRLTAPPRPLPVSEAAQHEILTLPCFPGMTDHELDRVVQALEQFDPAGTGIR